MCIRDYLNNSGIVKVYKVVSEAVSPSFLDLPLLPTNRFCPSLNHVLKQFRIALFMDGCRIQHIFCFAAGNIAPLKIKRLMECHARPVDTAIILFAIILNNNL